MYTKATGLYGELKKLLLKGGLQIIPSERELCKQYDLGRYAVRSALQQLENDGFIFNDRAHHRRVSLKSKNTLKKVMILQTRTSYYNSPEALALISEINDEVRRHGGEPVLFFSREEDPTPMLLANYRSAEYSGIISVEYTADFDLQKIINKKIPLVIANLEQQPATIPAPASCIDFRDIGRFGTRELLRAGCRKIAIISKSSWLNDEITAGMRGALAEEGIPFSGNMFFHYDLNAQGSKITLRKQLMQILVSANRPDGFLVFRNARLFMLLQCCAELGLKIPDDIKICVYECPGMYEFDHNIFLIDEPIADLGSRAVQMLCEWISSRKMPETVHCSMDPPHLVHE